MPRLLRKSKEVDAREHQIGQDREAMIALEGPAVIDKDDIEIVPGPRLGDKMEAEAFMAEKLTILIHSGDRFAENPVPLGVNGRMSYIWRNQKTIVPRYLVYQLAKSKKDNVTQDATSEIPEVVNKLQISSSLRYPFSVLHDPSPKGQAWLQKVLSEV